MDMVLPQDGDWMWCFEWWMGIGCGASAGWELGVVLPRDGNWMWCWYGCGASAGWELDVVLRVVDGNWMWCFRGMGIGCGALIHLAAFETRECVAENSMWLPPYLNQLNVQRN